MRANDLPKRDRWRALLDDVRFEESDRGVFDIPDPLARARALRRYFFPKLNVLLDSARSLISAIYGGGALEVFTEAQRPKPKEGDRKTHEFEEVRLGLVGVRVVEGLALVGSSGKPVQYGISCLWFEVFRRGTIGVTFAPMLYGDDSHFDRRVSGTFLRYQEALNTICLATFVSSPAFLQLATLEEALEPASLRRTLFMSRGFDFPVGREDGIESLVLTFASLFPFQKLVTDLSMRRKPSIETDLDALFDWWNDDCFDVLMPERYGVPRAGAGVAVPDSDWERGARVMITGAQRFRILDRDDYRCLACGRNPETGGVVLHVDHIKPRSKGGTDDDENLQTLCSECNIGKSNRSDRDLRGR